MNIEKKQIYSGIIAAILTCFAAIVIIDAGETAGIQEKYIISWISSIYIVGGLISLLLTMKYKMPLIGAHSMTAAIFLTTTLTEFNINQIVGGYLIAGIIILVFSQLSFVQNFINSIPSFIIEGMLAGIVVNYILTAIVDLNIFIIILLISLVVYLFFHFRLKNIPGFFGGLLVIFFSLLLVDIKPLEISSYIASVEFIRPDMSWITIMSISIPVAFLIFSNEVAISLSALKKNNYIAPAKQIIFSSGIGTMLVSLFGGHAAGIGGMSTTICSSEEVGAKKYRYKSAILATVIIISFGIFSPFMLGLLKSLPSELITITVILTLLGILLNSLNSMLQIKSKSNIMIMLIAFIIPVIDIPFFYISSPLVSIIISIVLYKTIQK